MSQTEDTAKTSTDASYETWPGEHLIWRGDNGERRPAVVQTFNAHQRVADLLFTDTNETGTVSVLELDPGGAGKAHYGVGVGQTVLLCECNHTPSPEVPTLGRFETQMDQMVWRDEMAKKADEYAMSSPPLESTPPQGDRGKIDWFGEVVNLALDGTVDVRLANGQLRRVGIRQLQVLGDASYMEEMMGGGGHTHGDEWFDDGMDVDGEDGASQASWETMSGASGSGSDLGDEAFAEEEEEMDASEDEKAGDHADMGGEIDEDEQDRRDVEEVDPLVNPISPLTVRKPLEEADAALTTASEHITPSAEAGPSKVNASSSSRYGTIHKQALDTDDEHWQRFAMLEEAPADHHFIGELSNQAGAKTYHTRLAKEHRALASSLPGELKSRMVVNTAERTWI